VAWGLIEEYGCGIRLPAGGACESLRRLLLDGEAWLRMARGAVRMAAEQFCLDKNLVQFREVLRACAADN